VGRYTHRMALSNDRLLDIDNPWGRVKAHLLCGLGSALRCQCILLPAGAGHARVEVTDDRGRKAWANPLAV